MLNPDPQKVKKLKLVSKMESPADILLLKHVDELEKDTENTVNDLYERIEDVKESFPTFEDVVDSLVESIELPEDGDDGYTPTKGVDYFDGEKGDVGPQGEKGIQGERGLEGKSGKDGHDGRDGVDGRDGLHGKDGSSDTPEQVVEKINASKVLIDPSQVKGLKDIERIARDNIALPPTTSFYNGLRAKNLTIAGATATQTGDTVTLTVPSGTPSVGGALTGGVSTRVLFDDVNKIGEDSGFTYNKTTKRLTTTGIGNGFLVFSNLGELTAVPGSSVNAASGNLGLSADIAFQTGNSIFGLGTLNFSASGANDVVDISNLYFDGNGGGIQNWGDSSMLFGAILDGNSGTLTGYSFIGSQLNYLDDSFGNGAITGILNFGSLSGGSISGTTIGCSSALASGDIIATNNIGGNGIRLSAVAQGANTTATISDYEFSMDASSGARTVTFPIIGTLGAGKIYRVIKTDSTTNTVTPTPTPTNTMNNGGAGIGYAMTKKNQYTEWQAVGSNWQLIGQGYLDNTVNSVALTNQSADIGATNFVGGSIAGTYRLNYVLQDTVADGTAGTVSLTIGWTDGAGATTFGDTQALTGTGRRSGFQSIQLASGNITYAISHTGIYGTSKFALYLTLERLS